MLNFLFFALTHVGTFAQTPTFICGREATTEGLEATLRLRCDPGQSWQINTLEYFHYWCCVSNGVAEAPRRSRY